MNNITRWFLDNPVAANLLMVFILVSGFLTLQTLRVESFPQIPPSRLLITVEYPGGTARQVDESITQRIEDAISSVPGIKSIVSESYRGYAEVKVRKKTGVKLDKLMEDVRNQVEGIVGFPAQAHRPKVVRDEFGNLASFILVYGGADRGVLQEAATRVQSALKSHPDISQVVNLTKRQRELVITPDLTALKKYGLSVPALAERVHQWSLEYRSGELKTARGNIILRGDTYADNLKALQNLPIITTRDAIVPLSELAETERRFRNTDGIVRYQGQSAVALMLSTSPNDNLLKVSEATQNVLADIEKTLPVDIKTTVMADMAPYITDQIDLLSTNAWQGLLIVIVLLGLFLELRLAFWVALGIPISLAGAVWLMGLPQFNYSLNDITLFGMILVLGILVDDAVVVGESIHQQRQLTKDPKEAARKGVEAVSIATIFGVLTTIAAFSPMLWIENELAKVLAGFSAVVIFALIFSLVESKFILPSHLTHAHRATEGNVAAHLLAKVRSFCQQALEAFSKSIYQPLLRLSLRNKFTAIAIFFTVMISAYGLLSKGNIQSVFFPEIPGRYATLKINMDQDAALELSQRNLAHLEHSIQETNRRLQQEFAFEKAPIDRYLVVMDGAAKLELTAELSKQALAEIPTERFLQVWQETTGQIEGAYATNYTLAEEPAGGTAITISAPSRDLARQAAIDLQADLRALPGVKDVFNDTQSGKRQLQIKLNENGIRLGFDQRQLASLIGGAFGEIELHRLLDRGEETIVSVKLPEQAKRTLSQLKNTPVHIHNQSYVTLEEISDFHFVREPDVMHRRNRNEVVTVYWRQDRSQASPEQTWEKLQQTSVPNLEQTYPGVKVRAVGEFSEIVEVQDGFKKAMLLTILLIYVLLAVPLKSYWQPFIIMSVIPFGFAGAIYGHGLLGLQVSILSMFGMMAMTGVVINDSLVLMTRFNQLLREGMEVTEALVEAGRSRLRAIFLTTVTTVCGLLPLLSETSEQAQYLKPAAVSLVFGELLATPITLILVPLLLSLGRYKQSSVTSDSAMKTSKNTSYALGEG